MTIHASQCCLLMTHLLLFHKAGTMAANIEGGSVKSFFLNMYYKNADNCDLISGSQGLRRHDSSVELCIIYYVNNNINSHILMNITESTTSYLEENDGFEIIKGLIPD